MEGWKRKDLRSKDFDSIKELFDKAFRGSKRAGDELEQEVTKKQKIDDDQEAAKMKEITKIVPDEEEVAIDVTAVKQGKLVLWVKIEENILSCSYCFFNVNVAGGSLRYDACQKLMLLGTELQTAGNVKLPEM
ncbi:hypothetical protein Tco_0159100 [Tanacetum coccineum]